MTSKTLSVQRPWRSIQAELGIQPPVFDQGLFGAQLERQAAEIPSAVALKYLERDYTFSDFNAEASRLANALDELVDPGDVVGLHMPNIPQFCFALAAVCKLGATVTGVSPLLTSTEITHQISDARIKVLISLTDLAPSLTGIQIFPECLTDIVFTGPLDCIDNTVTEALEFVGVKARTYRDMVSDHSPVFHQRIVDPTQTFVIQYTGGTTGPPKGAEISHFSINAGIQMFNASAPPPVPGKEVFGSAFPLFHIAGLTLILTCVQSGATCFLFPNARDTDAICAAFKKTPPTRLFAVPALYEMLLANPAFRDLDFETLLLAISGAAPLSSATFKELDSVLGAGKISEAYGMTETGGTTSNNPPTRAKPGSVGMPMPGSSVLIMDAETGEGPLASGEVGELWVSGPHIMKGYLGRPDATADALKSFAGETWMRTGDVGHMDDEGYFYINDRAKDMLIVGGYKVFSVEVEDKLSKLPEIRSCAVVGAPDPRRPGNDIVNLFVEASELGEASGGDALMAKILTFCQENMAAYKIPKAIHFVGTIPLTPVGKIDKKQLRSKL